MKPKSTKNTPKAPAEDEILLDCEASFRLKLKKTKVEPKLPFYLILANVLLATLFSQNYLLLPLSETFLFFFGK